MGNRLTKIYTRTGDDGSTGMADGSRVSKDSLVMQAIGDVDELNSHIGVLLANDLPEALNTVLVEVQHDLFNLGGQLSMPEYALITSKEIDFIEAAIDKYNADLPVLKEFILPAGSMATAQCHICRAICRRAERTLVRLSLTEKIAPQLQAYMNRLSDMLFVFARVIAKASGDGEVLWQR